ncbi:S-adenosyl-L-methionine-dependent methyltransferase [Pleurotus eryngii]|uniref:S-adenosyl-L-methionine-dependent methyltransferase n=1 Tax=Pleurotus eryngii TaxID=5323 RepID=A0A9P6A8Q3_PLEER|nr:S-adenosyl-L-methionine-dependent methyltransferase [Pleurotus eryngii]
MALYQHPVEYLTDRDDDSDYFRNVYGRALNSLNERYMLPVDHDEVKRSELHHRMMQFVFNGKSYIGPVSEVLHGGHQRRVLDLGTGGGCWAIDIADEFPKVEVVGVDLAPIQPRSVPPNCTFELCDLDQWTLPYPDNHFDLIHARSMHTGISNYPRLVHEISRILKPGGLVILIEPDLMPIADGKPADDEGLPGWFAFWQTYRGCLKQQGIDTTVPSRLPQFLSATKAFHHIVTQDGNIPVGFWPKDPLLLTVGQLAWMDCDLLIPALKPLFLHAGLPESKVTKLIKEAQQDLYYPLLQISCKYHIVHAFKRN